MGTKEFFAICWHGLVVCFLLLMGESLLPLATPILLASCGAILALWLAPRGGRIYTGLLPLLALIAAGICEAIGKSLGMNGLLYNWYALILLLYTPACLPPTIVLIWPASQRVKIRRMRKGKL